MTAPLAPIGTLVPHTGAMQLLDSVIDWDDQHAVCHAVSHRDDANPLRSGGRLHALAAIEYAAQAMAVHGGLTGEHRSKPASGYLVSLRDVTLEHMDLDQLGPVLVIRVDRVAGDTTSHVYRFAVGSGPRTVARGQATVLLTMGPEA